jgi:hypothetical protein
MNPERYFNLLKSSYQSAASGRMVTSKTIEIGGFCITMNFLGTALVSTFYEAFAHLRIDTPRDRAELTLYFWDGETTGSFISEIPWRGDEPHHLGLIQSFTTDRFYTLHQPGSDAIYMLDRVAQEAYYWVSSPSVIPYWESDFPLRMILHWWFNGTGFQPVHAAAIGTENGGVLLAGKGGSGKSTTALLCLNSSLKIAGDDYVLLDCEKNVAYSLFSLTKLTLGSIQMLTRVTINTGLLDPPVDDKYRIKLYPGYRESLVNKIPVKALLLPEITSREHTAIEPCGMAQAMLALAPTTLFQLPGLREESFRKMSGFVRGIPAYRLFLGKDSQRIPDILQPFISSLSVTANKEAVDS